MAMMLFFEAEGLGVICAYGPIAGRSDCEKDQFHNEMACECDLKTLVKCFLVCKSKI